MVHFLHSLLWPRTLVLPNAQQDAQGHCLVQVSVAAVRAPGASARRAARPAGPVRGGLLRAGGELDVTLPLEVAGRPAWAPWTPRPALAGVLVLCAAEEGARVRAPAMLSLPAVRRRHPLRLALLLSSDLQPAGSPQPAPFRRPHLSTHRPAPLLCDPSRLLLAPDAAAPLKSPTHLPQESSAEGGKPEVDWVYIET